MQSLLFPEAFSHEKKKTLAEKIAQPPPTPVKNIMVHPLVRFFPWDKRRKDSDGEGLDLPLLNPGSRAPYICWLPPLCAFSDRKCYAMLRNFPHFSRFPPPWEFRFLPLFSRPPPFTPRLPVPLHKRGTKKTKTSQRAYLTLTIQKNNNLWNAEVHMTRK